MEKHCTMVYFSLRESKQNKKGLSPIEVSITTNRKRIYFSTSKHVPAADWNKEKQAVKGKSEEAQLINGYLIQLRNKIYQKEIELLQKGYLITAELLKEAITDKVEALNEKTLLDVLNEHNTERKAMVGKTVAPATYWVFEYTGRLFKEFIQKKYERKDLYLREINLGFIQGFHAYLLGEKKMGQNSCTKHLKFLKKLLNLAVANSYISYNPVNAYKVEREPVEIDFLDEEELRKIINFDTPLPRLERAKDMFLFGCFTGLSYIDIKTLAPEHFEKDSAGRIWIKKRRIKTGVLSRIPLLPIAKLILDKYKGGEKLLPIQDPADINKYLKDIAILCGINKRICFHTRRHSHSSFLLKTNDLQRIPV
ncbi:site-specific integrase [Bacteroides sp. L10-4]|uniref:site-specific integrase n=2 Tax=Bacteroides TaxID=816 RepID=UPI00159594DC|nr:site-specific integrase [Bacteroides sp. L10-4]NVK92836.1 site-specific integrase [Bacteroides sp. L10-4]